MSASLAGPLKHTQPSSHTPAGSYLTSDLWGGGGLEDGGPGVPREEAPPGGAGPASEGPRGSGSVEQRPV